MVGQFQEVFEILPCLETLGKIPFRSWTLTPFLDEFGDKDLIYLDDSSRGIVISFAEQRIVERLMISLLSGSKFPQIVVECLQEIFKTDIGRQIATSMNAVRSWFHDLFLAFLSTSQKKLPQLNDSQDAAHFDDMTIVGKNIGKPNWIQGVTILLLTISVDPFLKAVLPLCHRDLDFCA